MVVVAQADPADVPRVGAELRTHVEPPEHQALVGGVELGDPLGRLEHHGVALDQAALVTEAPAVVPLPGQLLGGLGRLRQLHVHPVDELLLSRDLPRQQLFRQTLTPHRCVPVSPAPTGSRQVLNFTR